jgi:acyl carrier protein
MSHIREAVRRFVVDRFEAEAGPTAITDDTNLKDSGILDSFSTLTLVSFIEDEFKVQLEVADMESGCLFSVSAIEQLVLSRRGSPL